MRFRAIKTYIDSDDAGVILGGLTIRKLIAKLKKYPLDAHVCRVSKDMGRVPVKYVYAYIPDEASDDFDGDLVWVDLQ